MTSLAVLSSSLQVEILPDGRTVKLLQPLRVKMADGAIIEVPAGFETDFASVPRACWQLVPPWGQYSPAAVVHDYLYNTGQMPRVESDNIFLDVMAALGVPWWQRQIMYWGVRIGGWLAWAASRRKVKC